MLHIFNLMDSVHSAHPLPPDRICHYLLPHASFAASVIIRESESEGGKTGAHSRLALQHSTHCAHNVPDSDFLGGGAVQLLVSFVPMPTWSTEQLPQLVDPRSGQPDEVDPWNASVASLRDMPL